MSTRALLFSLGLLLVVGARAEARDPEPAETVRFARTWDEAVEEAKLLNVPLVVHSHGFY